MTPTPLIDCPSLAARTGVARVLVKDEGKRPLGNFKILGGLSAGLAALSRAAGVPVSRLSERPAVSPLPRLLCASDGNHGLAVAAAARLAGAQATIYLHPRVEAARAQRITALGAVIITVEGTYDDAVLQAAEAARRGEGLLIPDTSEDPDDPVVHDVMRGYAAMTDEIREQLRAAGAMPTHVFAQAGVGGLAATLAEELGASPEEGRALVVVEPENAACVGDALNSGRIERIEGDLHTSAEMLSCGVASASAVKILARRGARATTVSEAMLAEATAILRVDAGIASTASGAAGLAGLLRAAADVQLRQRLELDGDSVVLLVSTEAAFASAAP